MLDDIQKAEMNLSNRRQIVLISSDLAGLSLFLCGQIKSVLTPFACLFSEACKPRLLLHLMALSLY